MNQHDFIGGGSLPKPEPRQERNTRPKIAEEKAQLALRLNELCRRRVPTSVCEGSVQATRAYVAKIEAAKKVLGKRSASVQELNSAISTLEGYWGGR